MTTIRLRRDGDPPGPGEAKLRIKTDADGQARVYVVTSTGEQLELVGVSYAGLILEAGDPPRAEVWSNECDVDVVAAGGTVSKVGG